MTLPHFLVIGAAKSGTVSLYHYLGQHPQIFMCPVNEPNFFALDEFNIASHFQGPRDQEGLEQHCVQTMPAYQTLFSKALPNQLIGESSPLYLFSSHATHRIKIHVPQVKIIAILRHPADRAFSNFQHYRNAGIEPLTDFRQATQAEPTRLAQGWGPWPFWQYVAMGFYARQLTLYFELFDRSQIKLFLFDDWQADNAGILHQIFEFLEVDSDFMPNVSIQHNLGGTAKSKTMFKLMTQPNPLKSAINQLLPKSMRQKLRDKLHQANVAKPTLSPSLRAELNSLYREDILQLQELIKHDLDHWLQA